MREGERCGICVYWCRRVGTDIAECQYGPPQLGLGDESIWPLTSDDDWCGRWHAIPAFKNVAPPALISDGLQLHKEGTAEPDLPKVMRFRYRNHVGLVAIRTVEPRRLFFGVGEWHKKPQWLLNAFDRDRQALRTFALELVLEWLPLPTEEAKP